MPLDYLKKSKSSRLTSYMARKSSSKIWILTLKADQEEVTACCGNFSSLLSQFGSELLQFIKLCDRYDDVASSSRTWRWLKFWEEKSEPKRTIDNSLHAAVDDLREQYGLGSFKSRSMVLLLKSWVIVLGNS